MKRVKLEGAEVVEEPQMQAPQTEIVMCDHVDFVDNSKISISPHSDASMILKKVYVCCEGCAFQKYRVTHDRKKVEYFNLRCTDLKIESLYVSMKLDSVCYGRIITFCELCQRSIEKKRKTTISLFHV